MIKTHLRYTGNLIGYRSGHVPRKASGAVQPAWRFKMQGVSSRIGTTPAAGEHGCRDQVSWVSWTLSSQLPGSPAVLDDPGVVILDATLPPVGVTPPVDTRARYLAKHIPGAVFFDIEELSDRSNPLPHMLPAPDAFSRSMSALGISDSMDNRYL